MIKMKRGDITTVAELNKGDRFYKQFSKSKTPYEFLQKGNPGKFDVCEPSAIKDGFPITKRILVFKGNTRVVYLRNSFEKLVKS